MPWNTQEQRATGPRGPFGPTQISLKHSMLGDHLLRPEADLDPGNLRQDVDRMAGDVERDAGNCGSGKPDDRAPERQAAR